MQEELCIFVGKNIKDMDYTKVCRDLIYRERRSLEEFAEEHEENMLFIDNMLDNYYFSSADGKERALRCFNTAYYLCTLIHLSVKRPEWNFSLYCDIAYCGDQNNKVYQSFTLSLVYIFLTHTYYEVSCKKLLEKLDAFFVEYKNALIKDDPFLDDYTYKDVCNDLLKNSPDDLLIAEEFHPRVIDKECIYDVMSVRDYNWVKFTNYWEERSVREIVKALGTTEDEKHNVVEILRQSSHGFYAAGCNDSPGLKDVMFDDIDKEIHLQFNPEDDQIIEDGDSDQEEFMELKPLEEVSPALLIEENAKLRDEIKQIKDFLQGAITMDDINQAIKQGKFGLGPDGARNIVADAIAKVENGCSFIPQPSKKDVVEKLDEKREENTEDEKDKLMSELREENNHLTNEVNRLTLENNELRKIIADGDKSEWIACFDGFLHPSLNAQAIADALNRISSPHLPKNERSYWWVFYVSLLEIKWIIDSANHNTILRWVNLHFNLGWDWRSEQLFKFTIDKKYKDKHSTKWEKLGTTGKYYAELSKRMKDTFVENLEGVLFDRKRFILFGCESPNGKITKE